MYCPKENNCYHLLSCLAKQAVKSEGRQGSLFPDNEQKGAAYLVFFLVLIILTPSLLVLSRNVRRGMQLVTAQTAGLSAERDAGNNAVRYLMTTEGLTPPVLGAKSLLEASLNAISQFNIPVIKLNTLAHSSRVSKNRSYILSFPGNPSYGPPRPDWGALEMRFRTQRAGCLRWISSALLKRNAPGLVSDRTCAAILSELEQDQLIYGNLRLNHNLHLNGLSNQTVYLIVRGAFELKRPLYLKNNAHVRVVVIAAGNILIKNILARDNNNVSLFLHSSTGSVTVREKDSNVSLCNGDDTEERLRLTIEAAESIVLGDTSMNPQTFVSCLYQRNPLFWPKFKIIGENST